ncbi:MAG: LysR family transcriptional regulator [Gammaproteobacteria bacterium MedPE]|nr:MAG: LysR family transcriptional regulator [Gammaproteobacteria bacterium MedPE]
MTIDHSSPITLEALTVLDTIDKQGSFAKAAQQLNKVPSALSYIVQKLEEQLEVTLFIRQGRRNVLTPAAKHLLTQGRLLLDAADKLSEQTKTIANGWEPKLRIAIDSIVDSLLVFKILERFISEHPTIEIDVSEEVLNGSWEALIDDRIDIVIGGAPPVPTQYGISTREWHNVDNIFVVNSAHPLAKISQPLSEKDIEKHQTIVTHDSAINAIRRNLGVFEDSRHFFVPTIDYKINAIKAGIGAGYIPRSRIIDELTSGELRELTLSSPTASLPLYIAWKTTNRGKGLARLVKLLQNS